MRGRQEGGREGGGNSSWSQNVHTHSAVTCVCVLSNDRVTDVVLVSIGRYPVVKNPFKLVKPLTHKTLGSECVCAYY